MTDPTIFSTIQPSNLANEVVLQLRRAIVEGRLHSGEHLAETGIAQQLGVSRSPVRDALRILEREGLVVNLPNRGSFVRQFTPQDIDEIFSLRMAIEILAAQRVIATLDETDVRELERLLEVQRQAMADGDGPHVYEADIDFHEYVCQRSTHSRLMAVWEGLRSQCQVLFHLHCLFARTHPDHAPTSLADHQAFIDAFSSRNLERIVALHTEINQRMTRQLKEELAEMGARKGALP